MKKKINPTVGEKVRYKKGPYHKKGTFVVVETKVYDQKGIVKLSNDDVINTEHLREPKKKKKKKTEEWTSSPTYKDREVVCLINGEEPFVSTSGLEWHMSYNPEEIGLKESISALEHDMVSTIELDKGDKLYPEVKQLVLDYLYDKLEMEKE